MGLHEKVANAAKLHEGLMFWHDSGGMRALLVAGIFCLAPVWAAIAGPLTVAVRTPDGRPVADAVVSISTPSRPLSPTFKFSWPLKMAQRDTKFDPFVLIVRQGAQVSFPNFDSFSHHVYSFSPAKTFEIKLYGRDESRSVLFPTWGVVAVGCNIHDSMSAYIYVSDTPLAVKTSADGNAVIADVPDGAFNVDVWHPFAEAPAQRVSIAVSAGAHSNPVSATVQLRRPRRRTHDPY